MFSYIALPDAAAISAPFCLVKLLGVAKFESLKNKPLSRYLIPDLLKVCALNSLHESLHAYFILVRMSHHYEGRSR